MTNINNPWLGLKSYPEGVKIYGRDKEIEDLSQKILYNAQTVIYGRSGIGKSSILKAGVFPILRRNDYFPVYVRFVHDEEQESYTAQIIAAVLRSLKKLRVEDLGAPDDQMIRIIEGYTEEVVPHYDESQPEGLWEFFHRHRFWYRLDEGSEPVQVTPVMIFDQFEEIFTLQRDPAKVEGFFAEFASLLNNICPQHLLFSTVEVEETKPAVTGSSLIKKGLVKKSVKYDYIDETNARVVLSLREDYLSHLERNIAHIPSLKYNRYCLLPLSEDKAVDIIMKPVPGLVEQSVAKAIICKVTGADPDTFEIDENPELEVDSAILSLYLSELYKKKSSQDNTISLEMVEQQGSDIISDFYESTIKHVSTEAIHFLEKRLVTKEKRRDSIYIDQALRHGVSEEEIAYLVEQRLLHEYTWREGRRIEFAHDVLCPIVHARLEKRTVEEENRRKEELLLQAQREKRRLRFAIFGILAAIFLTAFVVWDGLFDVKVSRYANIVKENTWMKGFNEISAEEATHRSCHYVFYKMGRFARYPFAVEARDAYGELTSEHTMSTYLVNHNDDTDDSADEDIMERLGTVVRWELLADADGKYCVQERAFDKDDNVIFCYNNTMTEDPSVFVSTYVNEVGFPIMMRDSCYIFLRTTMDEDGREVLQEFYDDKGFPVTNKDGAFKTRKVYFDNGLQMAEASLFIDGSPVIDRFGNCGWYVLETTEDGFNDALVVYYNDEFKPCRVKPDDVMFRKCEYDEHDRLIKQTYWKVEDSLYTVDDLAFYIKEGYVELIPDVDNTGMHGLEVEYDDFANNISYHAIDVDGEIYRNDEHSIYEIKREFDGKGNMIYEAAIDENDLMFYVDSSRYEGDELVYSKRFNVSADGDTTLDYTYEWDPEKLRYVEKDYYYTYYSYKEYDADKRITKSARFTIDDDLPEEDYDGMHAIIYDYVLDEENRVLVIEERYLDADGFPCGYTGEGSYHREKMIVDSVAHTKTIIRMTTPDIMSYGFDCNDTLTETFYQGYMNHYDEDFEVKIAESSVDETGQKSRTYENGSFYYTLRNIISLCRSRGSEYIGYYAVNEFDELSLTRYNGDVFAAIIRDEYYDADGSKLTDMDVFHPLVPAMEAPSGMGFRYGDILVQQDDWTMWRYSDGDLIWGLDLSPDYREPHVFRVLRYSEELKDYELVEICTEAGDERVMEIEYNRYYLTESEEDRVLQYLRDNIYPDAFEFVPEADGALYEAGIQKPMLVIEMDGWDMTEHFQGDIDSLRTRLRAGRGKERHLLLYDEDYDTFTRVNLNADTLGVRIHSYNLSLNYYDSIYQKYQLQKASE